jgi:type IX secretion system PorP/SprF family membrane protein
MLRYYVKILITLFWVQNAVAQEIHFSDIKQIPYFFNPAYTGFYDDDIRGGLIYRNQAPNISNTYNTLGFGADFSLLKQKNKNKTILGVGINGFVDKAGDIGFINNSLMANFSYIKALDKKQRFYISIGLQAGFAFRRINLSKATLESGYDGENFTTTIPDGYEYLENVKNKYFRLGTGAILFFIINDNLKFHIGASANNLGFQNVSFYKNNIIKQQPRYTYNFGLEAQFNQIIMMPYFIAQMQMPEYKILFGSIVKYTSDKNQFNIKDNIYEIGIGVGYRWLDAVILSAQGTYKHFTINVSYDINTSKLIRASNTFGAIEASVIYQSRFLSRKYKKPYKRMYFPKVY